MVDSGDVEAANVSKVNVHESDTHNQPDLGCSGFPASFVAVGTSARRHNSSDHVSTNPDTDMSSVSSLGSVGEHMSNLATGDDCKARLEEDDDADDDAPPVESVVVDNALVDSNDDGLPSPGIFQGIAHAATSSDPPDAGRNGRQDNVALTPETAIPRGAKRDSIVLRRGSVRRSCASTESMTPSLLQSILASPLDAGCDGRQDNVALTPESATPHGAKKDSKVLRRGSVRRSCASTESMTPSLLQNIVLGQMDADDSRNIVKESRKAGPVKSYIDTGRMSKQESSRTTTSIHSRQLDRGAAIDGKPGAFNVSSSDFSAQLETPPTFIHTSLESRRPAGPTTETMVLFRPHTVDGEPEQNPAVVTAFCVDQHAVEEEVRERMLSEAVEAEVMPQDGKFKGRRYMRLTYFFALLVFLVIVVSVIVVTINGNSIGSSEEEEGMGNLRQSTAAPTIGTVRPTLQLVMERGVLRCGVHIDIPGFSSPNNVTREMEGINIDQCRAISIAVFGTPDKVELVKVVSQDRFSKLVQGEFDVLSGPVTRTMGRQVFEESSQSGLAFSAPYFYAGMVFGGVPDYMDCAEKLDSFSGICRSMTVCVVAATTHEALLQKWFPGGFIIPVASEDIMVKSFANGNCTVIATDSPYITYEEIKHAGYDGPYRQGKEMFSKEPLSLCTRLDDPEWTNLVSLVVNVFFWAEEHNISKSNVEDIRSFVDPDSAGDVLPVMQTIISELGNYHDLYQLHLEKFVPRHGLNLLYGKSGVQASRGLLYSYPFGSTDTSGKGPIPGQTIDRILSRGYLLCGIAVVGYGGYPGYPQMINDTWFGLDATFCHALAAALFTGNANAVEFVVVDVGVVLGAGSLADGSVDVVAGAPVSLRADYLGYSFSPPYYYHHVDGTDTLQGLALMTLDKDTEWSSFVFWIVMALVYAEEEGIGPESIAEMPIVDLYGEGQKQMLRDCVFAFGTFGDIYNKTLKSVPRSGANLLNQGPSYGPQHFVVPLK